MLARTKLLTFILSFLVSYSLLVTFLGPNGYTVNRTLRKYSDTISSEVERKIAQIEMLKAEKGLEGEPLFYQEDTILIAENEDSLIPDDSLAPGADKDVYTPFHLSYPAILFLSFALSVLLTFLISLICNRRIDHEQPDNRKK